LNENSDSFWTYILENPAGRFYIGQTDDLGRRIEEHNGPDKVGTKFTHKTGPWRLVWSESHPMRSEAVRRERFIKSRKSAAWIRQHLLDR
jgi:putative endonuclease